MKNKKAEKVIERLREENETFRVRILGDKQNEENAFAIFLHCKDGFGSTEKGTYWGISKKTIELLKEAEIKFKILK